MSRHSITVVPVPAPGAEDVVVAGAGPDEGAVFTGTEDGSIFRISHDGGPHRPGRPHRRPPARPRARRRRAAAGLRRPPRPAPGRHRAPARVEAWSPTGSTGSRWCSATTPRSPPTATIWFSDSSTALRHRPVEGRLRPGHPHRPAAPARPRRHRRGGPRRARLRQRGRAGGRRVLRRRGRDRRAHRRTPLADRASGPGSRDLPRASDLPGYPDNIARGSDGLIWVTIASPTDPLVERLQRGPHVAAPAGHQDPRAAPAQAQAHRPRPGLRRRRPARARRRRAPTDGYHMVTGVREHDGRVWLGSLHEPAVAVLDLEPARRRTPTAAIDTGASLTGLERRTMGYLESISSPRDLRGLTDDAARRARRARSATSWSRTCSRTGGHLGPNLGVVELTLAIHRVFDSPARPGRLRHRPPGLRAQAAHRPGRAASTRCARRAASAATRARPSPSTTSSRTPTPRPRCPTPTGWPRPTRSAARTGTWSR